jgi:hypothetical protein
VPLVVQVIDQRGELNLQEACGSVAKYGELRQICSLFGNDDIGN